MAVRLPAKYALPAGKIMIERRDNKLILTPLDAKGWPEDIRNWFSGAFDDFELPERSKDCRAIDL